MGHMGGLINLRPGRGQYRACSSNTDGSPKPRKTAPCQKSINFESLFVCMYVCMYVCIEVALRGDAHGIGRSNWAKGRDLSGLWVQYPNPVVPSIPRHSRWTVLAY